MFNLFKKAFSPQKVLRTFPSYYYKTLENNSILKFAPLYEVNTKYNEKFDTQILLIPNNKNAPHYSRIYDTIFYESAYLKNKAENKISPLLVPEHQLIITVIDMEKEKMDYEQLRTLLAEGTTAALQLAREKGFQKPLIEYVNDFNKPATAEMEGIVLAAKSNLKIDPTLVCQVHEKLLIEEFLRSEGFYLKAEAFVVVLIYLITFAIALSMLYIINESNKSYKQRVNDSAAKSMIVLEESQKEDEKDGWMKALSLLSQKHHHK